jgi:hypothetical protein
VSRRVKGTALLLGLVAALGGCRGSEVPGPSCTEDRFCEEKFLCHPVAQRCVPRCEAARDCPSSAQTCAALTGAEGAATTDAFCQCETTDACGDAKNVICSGTDRICAFRCRSDVDCTHQRTCDRESGECR